MQKILIRKMLLSDLPGVLAIEKQQAFPWSEKQFREIFTPFSENLVIEKKETNLTHIVGFAVMQCVAEEGDILNIAIDTKFRRKGLGEILLTELLNQAKIRNLKNITLEVRISNQAAIQLYLKMGFQEVGKRKLYYRSSEGNGEDGLLMQYSI